MVHVGVVCTMYRNLVREEKDGIREANGYGAPVGAYWTRLVKEYLTTVAHQDGS